MIDRLAVLGLVLFGALLFVGCGGSGGGAAAPPVQGGWSVDSGPYAGCSWSITGNDFELRMPDGRRAVGTLKRIDGGRYQSVAHVADGTDPMAMADIEGMPWYGLQVLEKTQAGGPKSIRGPVLAFSSGSGPAGTQEAEVLLWMMTDTGSEELKSVGRMVLSKSAAATTGPGGL